MRQMAANFSKLEKFEGVDFRRWQKKMHFLLSSMNVVYVVTTAIPEDYGDDATVEQVRVKSKWENDDVCEFNGAIAEGCVVGSVTLGVGDDVGSDVGVFGLDETGVF